MHDDACIHIGKAETDDRLKLNQHFGVPLFLSFKQNENESERTEREKKEKESDRESVCV